MVKESCLTHGGQEGRRQKHNRQTDRGDREEKETGIPFKGIATMAYFLQPDPTR